MASRIYIRRNMPLLKQKMRTSAYATTPDRIKVMKYLLVEKVSLS